jgi:hypothetical protein
MTHAPVIWKNIQNLRYMQKLASYFHSYMLVYVEQEMPQLPMRCLLEQIYS